MSKLDIKLSEFKRICTVQGKTRKSFFGRLMSRRYAMRHWFLVLLGILASMVQGALLPLYGIFMSKMLFVLNTPDYLPVKT